MLCFILSSSYVWLIPFRCRTKKAQREYEYGNGKWIYFPYIDACARCSRCNSCHQCVIALTLVIMYLSRIKELAWYWKNMNTISHSYVWKYLEQLKRTICCKAEVPQEIALRNLICLHYRLISMPKIRPGLAHSSNHNIDVHGLGKILEECHLGLSDSRGLIKHFIAMLRLINIAFYQLYWCEQHSP